MGNKIKSCLYCGAQFWPTSSRQACCRKDHAREYHRLDQSEKLKTERIEDNLIRTPTKPKPHTTDWKEIDRRCFEAGSSYGQMVMRGLL